MAQYFEVSSQSDGNVEQGGQFFNGNQESEPSQIRYILTDDSPQLQTQQLVQLSADQVMVVDGCQPQIQGVVIDQSQIAYQSGSQFSALVQNSNISLSNQQTQHIYYMETSSAPNIDGVQTVQAVIDQASTVQQSSQTPAQVQPIVLNPQINSNSNLNSIRSTVQASQQRPALQIRAGIRPNQNSARSLSATMKQGLPQARPQQTHQQVRPATRLQTQMRIKVPAQQHIRPTAQQIQQVLRPVIIPQQKSPMVSMINRQLNALQQQKQQTQSTSISSNELDELDDTAMNTTPNQMGPYRKLLEQRHQLMKNPILSRLSSNIKITQTTSSQQSSASETINQVVNQVSQQQSVSMVQQQQLNENPHVAEDIHILNQKKPKAPPRPKNQNAARTTNTTRARVSRLPPSFSGPRIVGPPHLQTPRFSANPPPRFPSQQPVIQQQPEPAPVQQSPPQPQQPAQHLQPPQQQAQQINVGESQINYLITPPTSNRPRQQRPLPSYIQSSQIQQIIENTPMAEEFSDSIRMLVLLENGEQRLITFTLPREACTIQEVLEQVSVPFTSETNIQVTEANTNGINYIVTVGNISNFAYAGNEDEGSEKETDMSLQSSNQVEQTNLKSIYKPKVSQADQPSQESESQIAPEPPKASTPEPPKELPKLIPGKLAVCSYCGYTGEDFNKCRRCTRKLPDNVKSVDAPMKSNLFKNSSSDSNSSAVKSANVQNPGGKSSASPKKKPTKTKPIEQESVVISSDEEDEDKKSAKSVSEQLLKNLGASVTISPVTKEPSLTEIKKHVRKISNEPTKIVKFTLKCRTVRIGSYRFVPADDVIIDSKCVVIKAPVVDNKADIKTVRIDRGDIVKVLVCFNKSLPVIFYYLNVAVAPVIRELLNMRKESGLYYDPVDEKEDSYRKITLLPEDLTEDHKPSMQQIYSIAPYNIMDELNAKEANDILIKTCPKDGPPSSFGSFSEIKQILLYPKEGQGRLSINTEDYVCLAADQFLNDKIIDFYLKYLWENLSGEQDKVHIFSTFFYKRLTTKPTKAAKKSHPFEMDPNLSAAEKRHCRVKNWTKRINLFEKDYIVVPINENAHWFLAIICFPGMVGPQTFDGKPYNPEPKPKRVKKAKKEKQLPCDELMLSDKDEAESEDSDLESDDSEESLAAVAAQAAAAVVAPPVPQPSPVKGKKVRPPIKQPCILIFDSLAGPSRSRVVATLRDYLTVEFRTKMESERIFNRELIKGASVKVPQQTNFTDCGLYLLQYVEQFFKDPIKDFYIPIKGVETWFDEIIVTKKREDISNLIKELMQDYGVDIKILPDIALPTLNGKLLEKQEQDNSREHDPTEEEEQEDMFTDIEDSEMMEENMSSFTENGDVKSERSILTVSSGEPSSEELVQSSPIKPSVEGVSEKSDITTTVMPPNVLKPTLSEFPRQTNKDTLSYLKAKRIVRHKTLSDGPDTKKSKLDN